MSNILFWFKILISFFIVFSLLSFYLIIRPTKIISYNTPYKLDIKFEPVTFKTKDNILIKGWFIPAKNKTSKTIILLHGYPADKGNILASRIFLHDKYNLLFIDFRYLGKSGGHYSTLGKNEVLDLLSAINYLKLRGIDEIGVWGFSMGGSVALMATKQTNAIKAIVTESGYARLDWLSDEYYHIPIVKYPLILLTRLWSKIFLGFDLNSINPAKSSEGLKIPILILHSKNDNVINFRHAREIKKHLINNNKLETLFYKNKLHGEKFNNYNKTIQSFFDKNL
ncbi:alpha/beta fold hydrolase [Gammaproteobacteria bacterium]|nr:alpha/beta fold hydrolase [Gammaproteobacteria bacterium]